MKIIFICGTLEPGKDGVGDYTRRLAGELIRQNHSAAIIALNDKYVKDSCIEQQKDIHTEVEGLRLPSGKSWKKRMQLAKSFIDDFNPEWLSLQFVPYSFNKKGLPFYLWKRLKSLGKQPKWHIMFHELWIGTYRSAITRKITANLQRKIIKKIIKELGPNVIHTSLPEYVDSLSLVGTSAKPLPIFSNIPYIRTKQKNVNIEFKVGFFSQIEAKTEIIEYLISLRTFLKNRGKRMQVVMIGGNTTKTKVVSELERKIKLDVQCTGFLPFPEISKSIASLDLGISPVPRHALGKSGSVASFIAHGIPVVAPVVFPEYEPTNVGFFEKTMRDYVITSTMHNDNFLCANLIESTTKDYVSVDSVAKLFTSDLIGHKNEAYINRSNY